MTTRTRQRSRFGLSLVLVALALVFVARQASAYIIYTKDGTRIEARDKPSVNGKRLLFLNSLGSPQSISTQDWDQARTEKVNQDGFGNAYVLDESASTKVIPNPVEKGPSLSQYIQTHRKNELGSDPKEAAPKAVEPPVKPREADPPMDVQVNEVFARAFDAANVKGAKLTAVNGGVRVQAVTENEQQVFWTITAAARGLKEARATGRPVSKVELKLVTSTGDSAGTFDMTPEDADSLLNTRVTAAKYFVAHVIF